MYFLGTLVLLLAVQELIDPRHTETLACSDFKRVLKAGQMEEIALTDTWPPGASRREGSGRRYRQRRWMR